MTTTLPSFAHALITRDERGVYTLQIHDAKSLNILSSAVILSMTEAVRWPLLEAPTSLKWLN